MATCSAEFIVADPGFYSLHTKIPLACSFFWMSSASCTNPNVPSFRSLSFLYCLLP